MELINDYDCTFEYHPGKANVVADALSRKSRVSISHLCRKGTIIAHCRSPLTLTPPVSDPVTCSAKCRCEERPTHTCRVFPCFSGVAASCLTA